MERELVRALAHRDIFEGLNQEEVRTVLLRTRYEGYIQRQRREIQRFRLLERIELPGDIDYFQVPGLSTEVREKLTQRRPRTLGEASRMEGITPAAITALFVYLRANVSDTRRHSVDH